MGGLIYWTIRALVMVAFYAFVVTIIPALNLDDLFDSLPDFLIFWFSYFQIPLVLTVVVGADIAAFVIRRFNP